MAHADSCYPGEAGAFLAWVEDSLEKHPDCLVILSIDGCHVGPRFGHPYPGNELTQKAVLGWEKTLWDRAAEGDFQGLFNHLSETVNPFHFDGAGALSLILQHQHRRARMQKNHLWLEESDQSFVTFTGGVLEAFRIKC